MIEVSHLTKRYGNSRGVSDISFSVKEGEVVGFLGPNGAGKTTTMNVLTGYLAAQSGAASVAGIDVLADPLAAKRRIGYLPEHPPLYLEMTVREYLSFIYALKGLKSPAKKAAVDNVAALAGITDVMKRVIRNLSKGYRQRVGLAQAMLGDPDVLILDEPTVGLDPLQIKDIRKTIKDLGKKRTVILSTHILPEVSAICERVIVIANGKIVADGKPDELANTVAGQAKLIVRLPGNPQKIVQTLQRVDGVKKVETLSELEKGAYDYAVTSSPNIDIRKPLFNALVQAQLPVYRLQPETMTLENLFYNLVSGDTVEEGAVS